MPAAAPIVKHHEREYLTPAARKLRFEAAGVRQDNLIVAVQGRMVTSAEAIHQLISAMPADMPVTRAVIRDERRREADVPPVRFAIEVDSKKLRIRRGLVFKIFISLVV